MTPKQRVVVIVAMFVIAAGVTWRLVRCTKSDDATNAPSGSASVQGSATLIDAAITEPVAAEPKGARRMTQDERAKLIETIRESYRKRTAPSSGSTPSGPPPALPEIPIDNEYIFSAVRELMPMLKECYEEGLERDPKLQGNIAVELTIEGEPGVGAVIGESKIIDAKTDLKDAAVQECIAETMHALQISPPANGGTIRVINQFSFAPE